jgi:hypothetical protein
LEVAIRSVEAGQAGECGLLLLMVLSLLHSTARTILAKLPDEALELMSQDGRTEQARYLALQHPTPGERSEALLRVARAEMSLGRRFTAADTLALARQEAMAIPEPADRCRALITVLQAESADAPGSQHFAAQLAELCALAESVTDAQRKTHLLADLAAAAEGEGLTDVYGACVAGIQRLYLEAAEAQKKRRRESKNAGR